MAEEGELVDAAVLLRPSGHGVPRCALGKLQRRAKDGPDSPERKKKETRRNKKKNPFITRESTSKFDVIYGGFVYPLWYLTSSSHNTETRRHSAMRLFVFVKYVLVTGRLCLRIFFACVCFQYVCSLLVYVIQIVWREADTLVCPWEIKRKKENLPHSLLIHIDLSAALS